MLPLSLSLSRLRTKLAIPFVKLLRNASVIKSQRTKHYSPRICPAEALSDAFEYNL